MTKNHKSKAATESDIDALLRSLKEESTFSNVQGIDSLLCSLGRADIFSCLPGIEELPAFRQLVARYIQDMERHSVLSAKSATMVTLVWLVHLRGRVLEFQRTGDGTKRDRWLTEIQSDCRKRQAKAVKLLDEAAALLNLTVLTRSGPWSGIVEIKLLAEKIRTTPTSDIFQWAYPAFEFAGQVGTSGGASDPEGALRGMAVRQIAKCFPKSMLNCSYATIAALMEYIGLPVDRQYVRALLMRGRT